MARRPARDLPIFFPFLPDSSRERMADYMCLRVFLLLWLSSLSILSATQLQADGAIDTRFGLSERWDVVLHNRARVKAVRNEWFDVSLVPTFRYRAHPRVQLFGGAFFTWYDYGYEDRTKVARPFAGVEPTILQAGKVSVLSRTTYERFFVGDQRSDYNRYRQRFRVLARGKWSPYANLEFFFLDDGIATTRYGVGVRRDLGKRDGVEVGYWYEAADVAGRGVRHMINATFHLNFKGLAPDF